MTPAQGLLPETQDRPDGLAALALRDRLVDIGEVIKLTLSRKYIRPEHEIWPSGPITHRFENSPGVWR